jgi:hypothetical protein
MTSALEEDEWSVARSGRTLPPGKIRYPLYRRLGGPQGRSGQAENLAPTGIRSPDRPARSQSLYRLSYPAQLMANESYEKRRGPRQCTKPTRSTPLFLPLHFSIHLNQIQSDDRCNMFFRNVKLIYFPTEYNDADDYHSATASVTAQDLAVYTWS